MQQEPILFHRSLAENIAFHGRPGASTASIEQAARLANARMSSILRLPKGYGTMVGERGVEAARAASGRRVGAGARVPGPMRRS